MKNLEKDWNYFNLELLWKLCFQKNPTKLKVWWLSHQTFLNRCEKTRSETQAGSGLETAKVWKPSFQR